VRSLTTEIVPATAAKWNCSPPVGSLGSPLAREKGRQGGTPPALMRRRATSREAYTHARRQARWHL